LTPSADAPGDREAPAATGWRHALAQPSWAASIGVFVVTAGWVVGMRALSDNSFLTHLATGRIILEEGSVPSQDAYTFTASGEPWVVQSWLASVLYASAERLGGLDAVRVVIAVFSAALAGLGWTLLRPATSLIGRLAAASMFLVVGADLWAERPLMIGLVCFALLLLAMEGRLDPRWLVPVGWVWVNTHGSFPLGLVALALGALGAHLDGDERRIELRALKWAVPGMLLGAIGPLGIRVLTFPVELLRRQDLLANVIEWRAPTFQSAGQRVFVLQLVVVILLLCRRPTYRGGLLVGVFTAAALLGSRNLVVASLVFLPVMAPGLAGLGSLTTTARPRVARLVGAAGVAALVAFTVVRFSQTPLDLRRYPVDALAYLEEHEVDTREVRLATPDIVGNLIGYVYGPQGRAFYDDRFDMFPEDVSEAHLSLINARPDLQERLREYDIDLVTVSGTSPTGQLLVGHLDWRALFVDEDWVLVCRRGADLGGTLTTC
jgi:hypothetical protein